MSDSIKMEITPEILETFISNYATTKKTKTMLSATTQALVAEQFKTAISAIQFGYFPVPDFTHKLDYTSYIRKQRLHNCSPYTFSKYKSNYGNQYHRQCIPYTGHQVVGNK